jgi:hypothetical protein
MSLGVAPGGKHPLWIKVVSKPPSQRALIGIEVETRCMFLMMTGEQARRSMSFLCSSLIVVVKTVSEKR